jgi:hypothetical protein
MLKVVPLLAVIAVVVVVFAALKLKAAGNAKRGVYYLRQALFTPSERSFLGVLERSLPQGVRVFGKVRLADVFGVQTGLDPSARQAARNRIDRKHVDFLLVRTDDLAPLGGIELDDRSHEEEERQQRDAFVDEVFAGAGLPLLHVPAQKVYDPADLKAKVASVLASPRNG